MAQQQAPAVGEVMDGYRFKGGDPAQQSSWEQVAPVDVSSEYGAGARRLPNGVIERVGPRGGVTRIAAANGGTEASPMVGADARARFMINLGPLQSAQANLESMDAEGYNPSSLQNTGAAALEAVPFDGGWAARQFGGPDYNAYNQAAKTFEAAIMPIMSGAAVTPSEAQRLIRAALPQPGDTPEVLAQKSAQRRQMINAVAQGIGQEAPYADPQTQTDEYGLPDYGIDGGQEASAIPAGADIRRGPDGKSYAVVNSENLAPEDTPESLTAAGYRQDADGTWFRMVGSDLPPGQGGGSGGGAPSGGGDNGGLQRGVGDAVGAIAGMPIGAASGAFVRAGLEQFPLADEAIAGLAGITSGQGYSRAREAQRALAGYDRENNGVERNMGGIGAGLALAATPFGAPVRVASGTGRVAGAVNAGVGGMAAGGAWGFGQGEGNALERLPEAGMGALVGGVAGPVAAPVANALNRGVVQPIAGALRGGYNALRGRPADPLVSGINRFADRSPQNVNALNTEAARFQGEDIAPTFADTVNDGGRGTLRALATRQTPARQAARDFADGRVEALPGRISRQARRIVSDDARPVEDIVGGLREARGAQARTTYAEPYAQTVPIDPQTAQALSGAPGRAALQRARAAAEAFNDAPAMQEIDALAAGEVAEVSAATLDRIRQALSGRAERLAQNPATRAVGAGVAQRAGMVDETLEGVEGLAPARDAYRQASRQIEATEMGGRFMNANPDEFAGAMQGLSPEQLQPARAATARSIEIAARNPGSAPGVARRLYADPETANMGLAVMGDDMGRLQSAARAEAGAVRNAIEINPRAGSPTNINQQDTLGAAGAVLGVARDATNPLALAGRAISAIRNRGFNDAEAEAIVTAAIDPQQTERLIGMLSERMSRREARRLARAVRYQLTTGPQSAQQQ